VCNFTLGNVLWRFTLITSWLLFRSSCMCKRCRCTHKLNKRRSSCMCKRCRCTHKLNKRRRNPLDAKPFSLISAKGFLVKFVYREVITLNVAWSLRFKLEVFIWRHAVNVPKSSTTFRGILICAIFRPGICKNNTFLSTLRTFIRW
jgi:hypothetical protein